MSDSNSLSNSRIALWMMMQKCASMQVAKTELADYRSKLLGYKSKTCSLEYINALIDVAWLVEVPGEKDERVKIIEVTEYGLRMLTLLNEK